MGLEPFRHLVNDPRFAAAPMYLETPKEDVDGEAMDRVNLRTLRDLVVAPAARREKALIALLRVASCFRSTDQQHRNAGAMPHFRGHAAEDQIGDPAVAVR